MLALWLALSSTLAQQTHEWPLTNHYAKTPAGYFKGLERDQLLGMLGGDGALDALNYDPGSVTANQG